MPLDLSGRRHRRLHTARAFTRQYRALMNDDRITRTRRVVCFDMLWHRKSPPPHGTKRSGFEEAAA
jgi:hypothetical protein